MAEAECIYTVGGTLMLFSITVSSTDHVKQFKPGILTSKVKKKNCTANSVLVNRRELQITYPTDEFRTTGVIIALTH